MLEQGWETPGVAGSPTRRGRVCAFFFPWELIGRLGVEMVPVAPLRSGGPSETLRERAILRPSPMSESSFAPAGGLGGEGCLGPAGPSKSLRTFPEGCSKHLGRSRPELKSCPHPTLSGALIPVGSDDLLSTPGPPVWA